MKFVNVLGYIDTKDFKENIYLFLWDSVESTSKHDGTPVSREAFLRDNENYKRLEAKKNLLREYIGVQLYEGDATFIIQDATIDIDYKNLEGVMIETHKLFVSIKVKCFKTMTNEEMKAMASMKLRDFDK